MLESIATIAGTVTALVGLYYSVNAYLKKRANEKKIDAIRDLEKLIQEAKTDEERADLAKRLSDSRSK